MTAKKVTLPPVRAGHQPTALERRAAALERTKAKFGMKRFSFRLGRDCGQMVAFHLNCLGRNLGLASAGSYKDASGALVSLQRLGFSNLPDLCDDRLERIPFARRLIGDILQMPAEDGPFAEIGALAIYLGDGAMLGYHSDAERPMILKLVDQPIAVWSAL